MEILARQAVPARVVRILAQIPGMKVSNVASGQLMLTDDVGSLVLFPLPRPEVYSRRSASEISTGRSASSPPKRSSTHAATS